MVLFCGLMRKGHSVSRPDRQSGGTRRARQLIHIQNEYSKQKHIYTRTGEILSS